MNVPVVLHYIRTILKSKSFIWSSIFLTRKHAQFLLEKNVWHLTDELEKKKDFQKQSERTIGQR